MLKAIDCGCSYIRIGGRFLDIWARPQFNAELLQRTLRDFQAAFTALTSREQSEGLQCALKGEIVHPSKLQLDVFELEEFQPRSQKRKDWLPAQDSNLQPFG